MRKVICRGGRRRFFCAFALASAKRKKERESAKKKEREKSESAERFFALFPQPIVEIRFQSPKPLGRGEKQGS
jgi:hypothetical protein